MSFVSFFDGTRYIITNLFVQMQTISGHCLLIRFELLRQFIVCIFISRPFGIFRLVLNRVNVLENEYLQTCSLYLSFQSEAQVYVHIVKVRLPPFD